MTPRRSWLDKSTDIVVDELSQFDLLASREHVTEMIRDRLAAVSSQLHIAEQTARQYMDEEALRNLARNAAVALAAEQPGADLLQQPRTVPMTIRVLSRSIAGLAEAAHVRELSADAVAVHGALQLISAFALILHECPEESTEPVFLPPAALTRAVRLLAATAEMIRDGTVDPGVPDGSGAVLADAFDRDATTLRALLAEHAE